MTSWEGMDRRNFPRVYYPCQVIVRQKQDDREVLLTHTENIGIGGLCVILKRGYRLFSPVDVEIDLLDMDEHIHCEGRIVWSVRRKNDASQKPLFYDTGIEFVRINENDRQRLMEVVQRLARHKDKIVPPPS